MLLPVRSEGPPRLPAVLKDLVLDYYWSHRMWLVKRSLHNNLRHMWMLREIHVFYEVYYNFHYPYLAQA